MTSKIADTQNFFDLNSLNSIKQQSKSDDKESKEAALQNAAKQFEAIFMQMLLKSMRSAQDVLESDSPFNSESTKFYRDMHDNQLAIELSSNGSLGLSDLIVRQLGGDSDNFTPSSVLRSDGNLDARGSVKRAVTSIGEPASRLISASAMTGDANSAPNSRHTQIPFVADKVKEVNSPIFEQPKDFVSAISAHAQDVQKKLGVPFEVIIAQAALETGWGQKIIQKPDGQSSNNLFNIKADSRWQGDKTSKETLEFEQGAMIKKKEPFRVYQSLKESVDDYVNFLSSNERYQPALEKAGDVEQFLQGIKKAGYATDPNYVDKIKGILGSKNFKAMLGTFLK